MNCKLVITLLLVALSSANPCSCGSIGKLEDNQLNVIPPAGAESASGTAPNLEHLKLNPGFPVIQPMSDGEIIAENLEGIDPAFLAGEKGHNFNSKISGDIQNNEAEEQTVNSKFLDRRLFD